MGTSFLYNKMKLDSSNTCCNHTHTSTKVPVVKKKITKKFGLSLPQLESKISTIEAKLASLNGPENRSKRLRLFTEIKKLKQAQAQPEAFTFDKEAEDRKRAEDKKRRIAKKLERKRLNPGEAKKLKIAEILKQKAKDRDRRKHCLLCKKYGHTLNECESRQ